MTIRQRIPRCRLWLVALTALALAGCGATHPEATRSTRATIVGVNLNAPGTAAVGSETPNVVSVPPPSSVQGPARETFRQGEDVAAEAGCLGCHVIGANGNNGPGPPLTHIGARLTRVEITRVLVHPSAPMPSFAALPKPKLRALTAFLADLR